MGAVVMNAAEEAYARLVAARREISPEERAEAERQAEFERQEARLRRRMPKVY